MNDDDSWCTLDLFLVFLKHPKLQNRNWLEQYPIFAARRYFLVLSLLIIISEKDIRVLKVSFNFMNLVMKFVERYSREKVSIVAYTTTFYISNVTDDMCLNRGKCNILCACKNNSIKRFHFYIPTRRSESMLSSACSRTPAITTTYPIRMDASVCLNTFMSWQVGGVKAYCFLLNAHNEPYIFFRPFLPISATTWPPATFYIKKIFSSGNWHWIGQENIPCYKYE